MSDVKELEKEGPGTGKGMQKLSDIESIRQMRYRYWRAIRDVNLDALLSLFSENPCADFGLGQPAEGKEAVKKLYRDTVGTWKPQGNIRAASSRDRDDSDKTAKAHGWSRPRSWIERRSW